MNARAKDMVNQLAELADKLMDHDTECILIMAVSTKDGSMYSKTSNNPVGKLMVTQLYVDRDKVFGKDKDADKFIDEGNTLAYLIRPETMN